MAIDVDVASFASFKGETLAEKVQSAIVRVMTWTLFRLVGSVV